MKKVIKVFFLAVMLLIPNMVNAQIKITTDCEVPKTIPEDPQNVKVCYVDVYSTNGEDGLRRLTGRTTNTIRNVKLSEDWALSGNYTFLSKSQDNDGYVRVYNKVRLGVFTIPFEEEFVFYLQDMDARNEIEIQNAKFTNFIGLLNDYASYFQENVIAKLSESRGYSNIHVSIFQRTSNTFLIHFDYVKNREAKSYEVMYDINKYGQLMLTEPSKEKEQNFFDYLSSIIVFYSLGRYQGYNEENFINWASGLSENEILSARLNAEGFELGKIQNSDNLYLLDYFIINFTDGIKSYNNNIIYSNKNSNIFPNINQIQKDENDTNKKEDNNTNNEDQTEIKNNVTSTEEIENPQTGNFVPYIVIIAGVALAVGVFTISRKNTKIYKI